MSIFCEVSHTCRVSIKTGKAWSKSPHFDPKILAILVTILESRMAFHHFVKVTF